VLSRAWTLVVLPAATLLAAMSPPQALGAPQLDWTAVDRLVDRDGDGTVDGWQTPAQAASALPAVRVSLSGAGRCDGDLIWKLDDGELKPARIRGCVFEFPASEGGHALLVDVDGEESPTQEIEVRDHLVVSIGDSVASGEGNPDAGDLAAPEWRLEPRCHRSMRSGAAQATVALDRGNPTASVSFVPLGCSGATIEQGLLHEYAGIEPDADLGKLRPQVAELGELADQRDVDAVLLSVGANDIRFSKLVKFCVKVDDCSRKPFGGADTAAEFVEDALRSLREKYDELGDRLREHVSDDRVIAVEYFDPLRDVGGEPCERVLFGIDREEAAWAESNVLGALNGVLRDAAVENHWRLVSGVAKVFRDHGICAEGEAAWVRKLGESFSSQADLNGTLHPNGRGHLATAALIAPVLATALGEEVGTGLAHLAGEPEREDHGQVDWWWLPVAAALGAAALWVALHFSAVPGAVLGVLAAAVRFVGAAAAWIVGAVVTGFRAVVLALARIRLVAYALLVIAAVGAGMTFGFDDDAVRVAGAVIALLAAGAYALLRVATPEPEKEPEPPERVARFALFTLLGLVAFATAFVAAATLLGLAVEDRRSPIDRFWLDAGVVVLALVALWLVAATVRSFWKVVLRVKPSFSVAASFSRAAGTLRLPPFVVSFVFALPFVLVGGCALSARDTPRETDVESHETVVRRIKGEYDLLLVIDPGDPVGRRLINVARRDRAAGELGSLFQPTVDADRFDMAVGIAVPQPPAGGRRLWRLVEPPTSDFRELEQSLAAIPRTSAEPSPGSYGRLLVDALDRGKIKWRADADRGVAFLLDDLPTTEQLDRHVPAGTSRETVAPWTGAVAACDKLMKNRRSLTVPRSPAVPIAWEEALGHQCAASGDWPLALHAITGDTDLDDGARWMTWTRALDGRLEARTLGDVEPADAEWALREAGDAHTGRPTGGLEQLVREFRPLLRFDLGERLRPVDVDWLLEHAPQGGNHEICDHRAGPDECETLDRESDLAGSLDEYISLGSRARGGIDLAVDRPGSVARMYVHARVRQDKLYLGYWWFIPYNSSPWRSELNCLPGFTIADLSCFDHQGDWEGVTVIASIEKPQRYVDPYQLDNLEPEAVLYDSHGTSYRWEWPQLDRVPGPSGDETRPVVFVAAGSHAAYPAGCRRIRCEQGLGKGSLGEGRFDGLGDWEFNDDDACFADQVDSDGERSGPCLVALPASRDGRHGALWNAFPGRWGAAVCSFAGKFCYQTDGPRSPSRQNRFRTPWNKQAAGDPEELKDYRRDYASVGSSASHALRAPVSSHSTGKNDSSIDRSPRRR
jgi:GDSL-like Lipase/Acylhydrolase family